MKHVKMKHVRRLFYFLAVVSAIVTLLFPTSAATKLGKPTITGVSSSGTTGTVSFSPVDNAKGYQIQFAQNKKFSKGKKTVTTSATTASKKGLSSGKKYYVRVRAYTKKGKKKVYGSWSGSKNFTVNAVAKPGKPGITAAVSKGNGAISISYNKTANATKYEIQAALNSKFSKGKKTASTANTSATIKGLKTGKKYYIRVRAYNGKKTGSWSSVKKVTVTKTHTHDYYLESCTATCTSAGQNIYRCDCGASYSTPVAAFGHDWYVKSTDNPVQCIDGTRTWACRRCGETKTEVIKASKAHEYYVYREDSEAKHQACKNCGTVGPDIAKEKPKDPATNYSYEIKILNKNDIYSVVSLGDGNKDYYSYYYECERVYVFVKTNNPDYTHISLSGDFVPYVGEAYPVHDLVYEKTLTNSSKTNFYKVKNGYVFCCPAPEKAGKTTINVVSTTTKTVLASKTITVLYGNALAKKEIDNIVSKANLNDSMTTREKCRALRSTIASYFTYPPYKSGYKPYDENALIRLISHQGLSFQTHEHDCDQSDRLFRYILKQYLGLSARPYNMDHHVATAIFLDDGDRVWEGKKYSVFDSSPSRHVYLDSWDMIDPS